MRNVVHLKEYRRRLDGSMADPSTGEFGERGGGREKVADEVAEEGVGEGMLRSAASGGGEEVDGEGEIGGGEVGSKRLMRTTSVRRGDGAGEKRSKLMEGGEGTAQNWRDGGLPAGWIGEYWGEEGIVGESGKRVGKGAEE